MAAEAERSRILVVDDTKTNIAILVKALGGEYRLGVATGGAEALRYVQQNRVDLVLLDIMMPEMDGYEVCQKLKQDERTARIPVIFITALGEVEDKTRGFALGAVDYITKPFEVVEVKARVRTHLRIEQYQRELEEKNGALERAHASLEHHVRELEARDRLTRCQMSATRVAEACEQVMHVIVEALDIARAALYLSAEDAARLDVRAVVGAEGIAASVPADDEKSLVAVALRAGEPRQQGEQVAVPLVYRRSPLGVIWVAAMPPGRVSQEQALDTLWHLAGEATLVIHAAMLCEQLESGDLEIGRLLMLDDEDEEN